VDTHHKISAIDDFSRIEKMRWRRKKKSPYSTTSCANFCDSLIGIIFAVFSVGPSFLRTGGTHGKLQTANCKLQTNAEVVRHATIYFINQLFFYAL
jgi:hypothetical protein